MKYIASIVVVLSLILPASAIEYWPPQDHPTTMADYFQQRSWLLDTFSWYAYEQPGPLPPYPGDLGAFGVGNHFVYTEMGMSYPLNMTHEMCGPDYGMGSDFFGGVKAVLKQGGQDVTFTEEWLWQVRNAAICITKATSGELELYTVDYVPMNITAFVRLLIVKNVSSNPVNDVEIIVSQAGAVEIEQNGLVQTRGGDRQKCWVGSPAGETQLRGDELVFPIGTLAPGEEAIRHNLCVMTYENETHLRPDIVAEIERHGYDALLEEVRDYWRNWCKKLAYLETPDAKVNDFLDITRLMIKIQQAASGALAVMSRYTIYNIRDDIEPINLFARTGDYDTIRESLEYHFKVCWITNQINNSFGVDRDVSNLGPEPDWNMLLFMEGRNPVEAPSYLPMKYWEYYTHTADLQFVYDRWDLLRLSVLMQELSTEGLLGISGDEQWRWIFGFVTGYFLPEEYFYSSFGAFMYVPAADILEKFARLMGFTQDAASFRYLSDRVRQATDQYYWLPQQKFYAPCVFLDTLQPLEQVFEDINTYPLYTGYSDPEDTKGLQNLETMIELIGKPDGTIQSPMIIEAYDGMQPGIFLNGLARCDHPRGEQMFNAISLIAQSTGEIAEGHIHDGHNVLTLVHDPTGGEIGEEITARYRPWECGAVCNGMMEYLTGLHTNVVKREVRFFPHIPNDWPSFMVKHNRIGDERYDIKMTDDGSTKGFHLYHHGTTDFNVVLTLSTEAPLFTVLKVNGVDRPIAPYRIVEQWGRRRITFDDLKAVGDQNLVVELGYGWPPTPTPTPTNTPTITPTPNNMPQVMLAGYWDTKMSAASGGHFRLLAFISDIDGADNLETIQVFHNFTPVTITLHDDGQHGDFSANDGIFGAEEDFSANIFAPYGNKVLLSIMAIDKHSLRSNYWPYLEVR